MALRAESLASVCALSAEERTAYFEQHARYFPDAPQFPYAIRVGSKTLRSNDTRDLRRKFDRLLRRATPREDKPA